MPPPPTLTSVNPASRIGSGVCPVDVTGAGFDSGAVVLFAGYTAVTTFVSATALTATFVIPHTVPSQTFPVTVRNGTGQTSNAVNFDYVVPALITLLIAKQQLRVTDDLHDNDIALKSRQAEAIIIDYLKPQRTGEDRPDWPWTALTLPLPVQQAMLIMLTYLYEHRGDPLTGDAPEYEQIWKTIDALVKRFYDPAMA